MVRIPLLAPFLFALGSLAGAALTAAEVTAQETHSWDDCLVDPTALCVAIEADRQNQLMPEDKRNAGVIPQIAIVLAESGQFDAAMETARDLPPGFDGMAFGAVAKAQARAGLLTEAQATAALIVSPFTQANAWIDIVEGGGALLDPDDAQGLLVRAASVAGTVTDAWERQHLSAQTIRAMADIGMTEAALSMAGGLQDPDERDQAMSGIVVARAGAGDLVAAIDVAGMIADPARADWAQAAIAVGQADAGLGDAALATAAGLSDPSQQARTLARIAESLTGQGQNDIAQTAVERALSVSEALTPSRMAVFTRAEIALAQHALGLNVARDESFDAAWRMADAMQTGEFRNLALYGLSDGLSRAGQQDRARAVLDQALARALSDTREGRRRVTTLTAVAQAAVRADFPDLALAAWRHSLEGAMALTDPGDRVMTLSLVAQALSRASRGE